MIPLSDPSRRPGEFPAVWLIAVNVVAFGLELLGGDEFVLAWSVTPAVIGAGQDGLTLRTAMFLKGGVMHIFGNMVFFGAFAPVVEDPMGRGRFLAFYLLGGKMAFAAPIAVDPASTIPNLGASGAIAAVMGAFLVRYPHDGIKTLVPIGPFLTLMSIPTALLIGLWLLIQMLNEAGSLVDMQSGAPVPDGTVSILVTDGITEAFDVLGLANGDPVTALVAHLPQPLIPTLICNALIEQTALALSRDGWQDDRTVVAFALDAPAAGSPSMVSS